MADDPSGSDDNTDDRRHESSGSELDVGPTADADSADANRNEDAWKADDRADRPDRDARQNETGDSRWNELPLDLSGSNDADADTETDTEDGYTPEANSTPIEPGDPDLENALFVLLGAIAMILVLVRLVTIPLG